MFHPAYHSYILPLSITTEMPIFTWANLFSTFLTKSALEPAGMPLNVTEFEKLQMKSQHFSQAIDLFSFTKWLPHFTEQWFLRNPEADVFYINILQIKGQQFLDLNARHFTFLISLLYINKCKYKNFQGLCTPHRSSVVSICLFSFS